MYLLGYCACRVRIPSSVSGERRLRGIQPTGNLVVRAAFWICQGEEPVRGLGGVEILSFPVSSLAELGGTGLVGVGVEADCASGWDTEGGSEALDGRGL